MALKIPPPRLNAVFLLSLIVQAVILRMPSFLRPRFPNASISFPSKTKLLIINSDEEGISIKAPVWPRSRVVVELSSD